MIEWPEFELWLRRAESNLLIAQREPEEGVFFEDLCFEAQQAAEKALKGLLIYLTDDYPRTHSFNVLLARLEPHLHIPEEIREVVELSDYAVQTRYPGDYYPVSEEEYRRAVELAERVLRWVQAETEADIDE